MKKLFLSIILATFSLIGIAQTIGEAFYIYRNDGNFNAFYRDEIDSMAYSNYDVDSVLYNEVVTQVIYTQDSIYRIPLAAVDSVSFVTPETKYKPGVVKLEGELSNYLLAVKGDTLVFAANTPSKIVPIIGDKLTTLEMNNFFPIGFAGEVVKVEHTEKQIDVIYEDVNLEDVFECLFITSDDGSPESSRRKRLEKHNSRILNFGPYSISWINDLSTSVELQKDYAFSFRPELSFTYTPKFWVSGMVIITKEIGHYFSFTCTGEHEFKETFAATGNLSINKKTGINTPIGGLAICPFLEIYFEPGLFFKAETELSSKMTLTQRYNTAMHYEWSSKGNTVGKNSCKVVHVSSDVSGQTMLNGSVSAGVYFEIGVQAFNRPYLKKKNKDWGTLKFNVELGGVLESNAVLLKVETDKAMRETAVYERLKDTTFKLSGYWGTSMSFQPVPWFELSVPLPFGHKKEWKRWGHVPVFSNTTSTLDGDFNDLLKATTEARGTCFIPVNVGFVVKDQEENEIGRHYFNTQYQKKDVSLEYMFTNIHSDSQITVFPLVKWNDIEMIATPSSFSCPDKNHPHMIDLGLPSGTLWACCNVGANTPEDYGDYYAWGETHTKSYYGPSTYQFAVVIDDYHEQNGVFYDSATGKYYRMDYLGRKISDIDIAGTSYDAATTNLGASWCMPSAAQCDELINNTTSELTTQNEVYGRKFTGTNGCTIFLPAAGSHWENGFIFAGSSGHYWSSTQSKSPYYSGGPSFVFGINTNVPPTMEEAELSGWFRRPYGCTVRPVRKK